MRGPNFRRDPPKSFREKFGGATTASHALSGEKFVGHWLMYVDVSLTLLQDFFCLEKLWLRYSVFQKRL